MQCQRYNLTDDGRVYMNCYIQDWTPLRPFLPKRPAILICPGGAYILPSEREGEPVALNFVSYGYDAFVLNYSIGYFARFPNPVVEAALAVKAIRHNAELWHIDRDKIAVAGFSAGGHVASCLATMAGREDILSAAGATEEEIRPNAQILGYAVTTVDEEAMIGLFSFVAGERPIPEIKHIASSSQWVDDKTPPAFVFSFYNDRLVPVEQSLIYCQALAAHDRQFELHIFHKGEHGSSSADDAAALGEADMYEKSVEGWTDLCIKWLEDLFGKVNLGTKYASMLQSSAGERAHFGEKVLPDNLFEKAVTRKTPARRFSLSTRVGDAAENPEAFGILKQFFPEVANSPRLREFYEMPIQVLVLTAGGAIDNEKVMALAKALRTIKED